MEIHRDSWFGEGKPKRKVNKSGKFAEGEHA